MDKGESGRQGDIPSLAETVAEERPVVGDIDPPTGERIIYVPEFQKGKVWARKCKRYWKNPLVWMNPVRVGFGLTFMPLNVRADVKRRTFMLTEKSIIYRSEGFRTGPIGFWWMRYPEREKVIPLDKVIDLHFVGPNRGVVFKGPWTCYVETAARGGGIEMTIEGLKYPSQFERVFTEAKAKREGEMRAQAQSDKEEGVLLRETLAEVRTAVRELTEAVHAISAARQNTIAPVAETSRSVATAVESVDVQLARSAENGLATSSRERNVEAPMPVVAVAGVGSSEIQVEPAPAYPPPAPIGAADANSFQGFGVLPVLPVPMGAADTVVGGDVRAADPQLSHGTGPRVYNLSSPSFQQPLPAAPESVSSETVSAHSFDGDFQRRGEYDEGHRDDYDDHESYESDYEDRSRRLVTG